MPTILTRILLLAILLGPIGCDDDVQTGGTSPAPFGQISLAGDTRIPQTFLPDTLDGDDEIWVFGQGETFFVTVFSSFDTGIYQVTVQFGDLAWEVRSLPVPGTSLTGNRAGFADVRVPGLDPVPGGAPPPPLTLDGFLVRPE